MQREIYFSVTGRNEGDKLVPFFGEVRVGHESVTVFGEAEGLDNKLRAVLAAMHLANALGIAAFDIPAILEACGSSSKTPVPSRMEQKCSVRLFLTTPECAVFLPMQ